MQMQTLMEEIRGEGSVHWKNCSTCNNKLRRYSLFGFFALTVASPLRHILKINSSSWGPALVSFGVACLVDTKIGDWQCKREQAARQMRLQEEFVRSKASAETDG